MTDEICGAETTQGHPCQNPAESCPWHNVEDAPNTGRPTKLSKQRQEQIAGAVEQGKSLNSAARMAGVSPSAVYAWLDRGESEKESNNENEYTEFVERLTRAKGYGEDHYFNLAMELARENGDHRFIASLMKQRYPDSWGETDTGVDADRIEVSSEVVRVKDV